MAFMIRRGSNISHWLSQSNRRGPERRAFFQPDDVRRIAEWGFDHIRLPIDEEQMWDASGTQDWEAFDLMDAALDWAEQAGLKVVVDLHILRSHYFCQNTEPALFTNPSEAAKFVEFWRQLSQHLGDRAPDRVAYELMNEPIARQAKDWNRVALPVFQTLREREPNRTLVLGSNQWNSPKVFDELDVPPDPRTILTFHYYSPMLITHYEAPWWDEGSWYHGPIQYPGQGIPEWHLAGMSEQDRTRVKDFNQTYDRQRMIADLAKPLAVAKRTGCPLYCGEFGAHSKGPLPVRLAWYRDIVSVFKEFGIAWANWDYKGGFALVQDGQSTGIAEELLADD